MIDLHTHSWYSDGSLAPAALIDLAGIEGLRALALTDHDTLDGLSEAENRAAERDIFFIPGIEFSARYEDTELHLLGLGIDYRQPALIELVERIKLRRQERNAAILAAMRSDGIEISETELITCRKGVAGRPHIADLLVQKGYAKSVGDAFSRFIGDESPFYLPVESDPLPGLIQAVKTSGGRSVWAHPLKTNWNWSAIVTVMQDLANMGLDGIEAYHHGMKPGQCRKMASHARRYGLIVTGGSDFHGDSQPDRRLGRLRHNREVADTLLNPFLRE